jgi:hypothetical protein
MVISIEGFAKAGEGTMKKEEIIIIDEGLDESSAGTDAFCCIIAYIPFSGI